ncbi:hypothetical protein ACJ41O_006782 [Fusarium nematophilum]
MTDRDGKECTALEAEFHQVLHDVGEDFPDSTNENLDFYLNPPLKSFDELMAQLNKLCGELAMFRRKASYTLKDPMEAVRPVEAISVVVVEKEMFSPAEAIYGAVSHLYKATRGFLPAYDEFRKLLYVLRDHTQRFRVLAFSRWFQNAPKAEIITSLVTLFAIFVVAAKEVGSDRFQHPPTWEKTLGTGRLYMKWVKKFEVLISTMYVEVNKDNMVLRWNVYDPLRHEKQEIRLLTLNPPGPSTSDNTTLECTLKHVPLPKAPPYIALSYHWGSPEITTGIDVNGVTLQVTVNLEAALRRLQAEGVYTIWADALCIDQTNTSEKSLQVPRIGTIFRKASEVAIWLGDEPDLDETSREYLRAGTASKADQDTCLSTLPVFKHLLGRPFWRRVWIIQELAVASRITLYCGNFRIPWRAMDVSCACHDDGGLFTVGGHLADENVRRFTMLRQVRADVLNRQPIRLLNALHRARYSLATDPRDKIYALLGLAYDAQHFVPEPSYMSSMVDTFTEFATSLLTNGEPLSIIYLRSGRRKVDGDLPSWVPDWTDLDDAIAHLHFDHIMALEPASSLSSPKTCEVPDISISGSELTSKGVLIDTVNGLGSALAFEDGDASAHETTFPSETENPYDGDEEISAVVYQTLLPDSEGDGRDETLTDFHRLWSIESEQQLEDAMPGIVPRNN